MRFIKKKYVKNFILYFSIFAIIYAYFVEYILGYQPCNLCLLERIPYVLATIIIIFSLIYKNLEKISFLVLGVIFFLASLLALYHVGIEQGILSESAICETKSGLNILDKEGLLKELEKNAISCKNVNFTLFGISLATINTFISLIFSLITFWKFKNYEKK